MTLSLIIFLISLMTGVIFWKMKADSNFPLKYILIFLTPQNNIRKQTLKCIFILLILCNLKSDPFTKRKLMDADTWGIPQLLSCPVFSANLNEKDIIPLFFCFLLFFFSIKLKIVLNCHQSVLSCSFLVWQKFNI